MKPQITTVTWKAVVAAITVIGLLLLEPSQYAVADSATARWEIGRALIHSTDDGSGRESLMLRVSLRNQGLPDTAPVTFLGRWSDEITPLSLDREDLERFRPLQTFEQAVSAKNTAILEISLRPLGSATRNSKSLDVVVLTGSQVTDHKIVVLQPAAPQ